MRKLLLNKYLLILALFWATYFCANAKLVWEIETRNNYLSIHPNDSILYIHTYDSVLLVNPINGILINQFKTLNRTERFKFSENRNKIFTAFDQGFCSYDLNNFSLIDSMLIKGIRCYDYSEDNSYLAAVIQQRLKIYDVQNKILKFDYSIDYNGQKVNNIRSVCYSKSQNLIIINPSFLNIYNNYNNYKDLHLIKVIDNLGKTIYVDSNGKYDYPIAISNDGNFIVIMFSLIIQIWIV